MRYKEWEPIYREILADFGYSESEDLKSARALVRLLSRSQTLLNPERSLKDIIYKKCFWIVGPCLSKEDITSELQKELREKSSKIVSVGEGTKNCLESGIVPSFVFTDLDGFPASDVLANQKGAIVFVHAHGDNLNWLREWVPRFDKKVVPTCQCKPFKGIYNWGGFTDGDRAYCTLAHFGAEDIQLIGFDYSRPCGNKMSNLEIKSKKLAWAKRIIEFVEFSRELPR